MKFLQKYVIPYLKWKFFIIDLINIYITCIYEIKMHHIWSIQQPTIYQIIYVFCTIFNDVCGAIRKTTLLSVRVVHIHFSIYSGIHNYYLCKLKNLKMRYTNLLSIQYFSLVLNKFLRLFVLCQQFYALFVTHLLCLHQCALSPFIH